MDAQRALAEGATLCHGKHTFRGKPATRSMVTTHGWQWNTAHGMQKTGKEGTWPRSRGSDTSARPQHSTHLPWACWGRAGWQTPRPRSPAAAAPATPSDLQPCSTVRAARAPRRTPHPAAIPSMMCFRDRPRSVSALKEEKGQWEPAASRSTAGQGGCYLLSSPEDLGGDDQAGSSAGRRAES